MCEETCLICEQCNKYKNGCQGQIGTFDENLCPNPIMKPVEICSTCSQCAGCDKQDCGGQEEFFPENCPINDKYVGNGRWE